MSRLIIDPVWPDARKNIGTPPYRADYVGTCTVSRASHASPASRAALGLVRDCPTDPAGLVHSVWIQVLDLGTTA